MCGLRAHEAGETMTLEFDTPIAPLSDEMEEWLAERAEQEGEEEEDEGVVFSRIAPAGDTWCLSLRYLFAHFDDGADTLVHAWAVDASLS